MTSRGVTFSMRRFSFFSGEAATAPDIPAAWPVALGGIGYILDDLCGRFEHRSVPMLKSQQSAETGEPGEVSLNPESAWRRSRSTWHLGAGQIHADTPESTTARFRSSKGVDVWTRGQLSLLEDTTQVHTMASLGLLAVTDSYVYYQSAAQAIRQTNLTGAGTDCTGEPAANVVSMCSDGKRVFAAFGASGVYRLNADNGTVFAAFEASAATVVAFAKSRILSASGTAIRDISTGTATVLTPTWIPAGFVWSCIAEGVSHVYAGGNTGDKGLIYRIAIKSDGSGLDTPIVAGRLPDGETVHSLYGYLGRLFIGTSKGVRTAQQQSSGDLVIGPAIEVGTVGAFVGHGQYVWFSWNAYDASSTGAGRLDLQNETEPLVPAYASDLMVADPTGSAVDGLGFYGDNLVLGVATVGLYKPSGTLVTSGTIDSGLMNYGIAEQKILVGATVQSDGVGTAAAAVDADESGTFAPFSETGESTRGNRAELRLTLTRATTTTGPTVKSWVLRAYVVPEVAELILLPIRLAPAMQYNGVERTYDVAAERQRIRQWWHDKTLLTYQESGFAAAGIVQDFDWHPEKPTGEPPEPWIGTLDTLIKLVT